MIGDRPEVNHFQTHELTAPFTFVRFHGGTEGANGNYAHVSTQPARAEPESGTRPAPELARDEMIQQERAGRRAMSEKDLTAWEGDSGGISPSGIPKREPIAIENRAFRKLTRYFERG